MATAIGRIRTTSGAQLALRDERWFADAVIAPRNLVERAAAENPLNDDEVGRVPWMTRAATERRLRDLDVPRAQVAANAAWRRRRRRDG